MLRTTTLREEADRFELEMGSAWHFPPCSLLPFLENPMLPSQVYSCSPVGCAEDHTTPISRSNCWGQEDTIYVGPVSFLGVCGGTPVGLQWLLELSWCDQACGQQCLSHVQVCTERLSEEPARQQVRVKGRKEQRWETSSLRTCLRKRSCFGYGWPRVVFSLPGEWGVLSCVLALRFPASSSNTSFSLNLPRWELVLATKSILRRQMERKRKSGLRSGESMNKDMVVEKKNTTWENIRGKWKIKTGYLNTKARLQKA